jgi:predicted N-acetyltransferase YhbS
LKAELDKQPKGKGHIFLQALAVDPALQKRGVGARLLKWGIERSEREAVPIALVASSKAKGLYDKFGWNSVTEVHVEGITWGDHVMFRWPEGKEEVEAEELVKIGRTEEVPLVEDLKLEEGA